MSAAGVGATYSLVAAEELVRVTADGMTVEFVVVMVRFPAR